VMADYLEVRRALMGVVLMIDSRHGFTPLDKQLLDFIAQRVKTGEIKLLVLLTKCDKLGQRDQGLAVTAAQEVLGEFVTEASDIAVVLFSSMRRVGVDDVAEQMMNWKKAMPERVHFDVAPLPEGEGGAPIEDAAGD
jgi:GTP-binding protein